METVRMEWSGVEFEADAGVWRKDAERLCRDEDKAITAVGI